MLLCCSTVPLFDCSVLDSAPLQKGCSVRTADYRYTAWMHWDSANLKGNFNLPPAAEELCVFILL